MPGENETSRSRLSAVMREGERVKPLELFFDLVFVLAITQCTTLMVDEHSWAGIGQAMLVLALMWWSWTGYAWLTSVVDPEEGLVRISIFGAMAALLIVALSVPGAFEDTGLEFAAAYGAVRAGHIALFIVASRDDPELRQSTLILSIGTTAGIALLVAGSFLEPGGQAAVWSVALLFDLAIPFFFGTEGWKLAPGHFAERHWLIIIVALGESVVALGVGAEDGLTLAVITTAVLGIVLVSEMWWVYFDVVAIAGARRLVRATLGREQNALARDAYSYLHFILVAGIVIAAFGLHEALLHPTDPMATVFAFGLLGGTATYLIGHVTVRLRHVRTLNRQRLLIAVVCFALIPLAGEIAALATLAIVTALIAGMIAYETASYGEGRAKLRYAFDHEGA